MGGLSLGLLVSGLVSPWVGRLIDARGGRPALAASAVLLAAGLLILGLAPTLAVFVAGWLVMGLGMGAGLYDPAFSTLGRLYGDAARGAITQVTFFGGFASTVCWPLSAFLVDHLGWRGACLTYAAVHIGGVLPLYAFGVPRWLAHWLAAQSARGCWRWRPVEGRTRSGTCSHRPTWSPWTWPCWSARRAWRPLASSSTGGQRHPLHRPGHRSPRPVRPRGLCRTHGRIAMPTLVAQAASPLIGA